ncbi:hypothetical protein JHK84_038603 [Glycine max]|nr:hypothetical protein JHK84_038603 [Glycine max]
MAVTQVQLDLAKLSTKSAVLMNLESRKPMKEELSGYDEARLVRKQYGSRGFVLIRFRAVE